MFSPLYCTELMQMWNRLGMQLMRTQADALGASVLCPPAVGAADAAGRMPEHFGRIAEELLHFHPAREMFVPMFRGVQLATQSFIHWTQTCAERRFVTQPW
ncbi:hypothetical protein [Caldimonas tepidiphila]|uniref:hypothetical protein n=1 Tax=Caldimonas tepidiphila TaxID=2315841 RepID=UPI000E5A1B3D|nr:hypothetical protein [Caldimonas tepidiphila]